MAAMIAGYATAFGVAVRGQDVIAHGSFVHLIAKGFSCKMLLGHDGEEVGQWLQFSEDDIGLLAVGRLNLNSPGGRLALEKIEGGEIAGLSLGALVCVARPIPGGRLCRQVISLPEISLVTHPANPLAKLIHFTAGVA